MTDLTKPVRRRATVITDHRRRARNCDQICVTLYPSVDEQSPEIGFRRKGSRKEFKCPLSACMQLAVALEDKAKRAAKKGVRNAR